MSRVGLSPSYCAGCHSHSCLHAVNANAHNMRMEHDRMMAGMPVSIQGTIMRIEPSPGFEVKPDKKLLLLRRGK